MAGDAYPSPAASSHTLVGPDFGQVFSRCVSVETPLCVGPRKPVQACVRACLESGLAALFVLIRAYVFNAGGVVLSAAPATLGGAGSSTAVGSALCASPDIPSQTESRTARRMVIPFYKSCCRQFAPGRLGRLNPLPSGFSTRPEAPVRAQSQTGRAGMSRGGGPT